MFCLGLSLPTKWSNVTCFGITLICVPLHDWAKYLIWIRLGTSTTFRNVLNMYRVLNRLPYLRTAPCLCEILNMDRARDIHHLPKCTQHVSGAQPTTLSAYRSMLGRNVLNMDRARNIRHLPKCTRDVSGAQPTTF
jgi:hypothetical protein